jgi:pimeloyl-ACP methyl ester carboxylesterase
MQKNTIKFGDDNLDYHVYGHGPKVLITFHGFGQNGEYYESFGKSVGDTYTIYSFDLFFHANSEWKERNKALTKEEWRNILHLLLEKHHIHNFAVCGYSMGGKFALASLEAFPDRINQFILIAPDGIKTLFWYSLATYPTSFRKFFRAMITQPKYFYHILKFSKKLGIADKSLLKFANSQMNTRAQRRRVYLTWVVFRLLSFNMRAIGDLINKHQIPTIMVTGKYDKIITENNMMDFLQHVKVYENIVLEAGHNSLIDYAAEYFKNNKSILKFK